MQKIIFKKSWVLFILLTMVFTSFSTGISNTVDEQKSMIADDIISDITFENKNKLDHNNFHQDDQQTDQVETTDNNKNKIPILLKTVEFIPNEGEPELPEEFTSPNFVLKPHEHSKKMSFRNEEIEDYYLIQFKGPVLEDWKNTVMELGVELYDYIPEYSFVAYSKLGLITKLRSLEFVNWVGPFHSYYRVQPELMDLLQSGISDPLLRENIIMVSLRPITDMSILLSAIQSIGADILVIDADNYVVCELPLENAYQLIYTRNLLWMEFHSMPEPINNKCSRIITARQNNNGTYTSDGTSLWSYNHNTDQFEGFPGNDVVIAMVDSGVDGTHPAFDGKKIWFYNYGTNEEDTWTDGGFAAGHGTHTSGTSLGSGKWRSGDSGEAAKYAGMAPAAGLIGQAIFQGGGTPPAPSTLCVDGVKHGANISSNSWGWPGTAGNYDNTAVAYDGLVRNSNGKEFTIVFGTGNEGPGTIRSPSTGKNVISVGATDNNDGTSVTGFSSGGPTDDDRTKPDVVAPGQLVASCGWQNLGYGKPSDGQNSYFYATGTSMSTPAGAGAAAVVMDFINHTHGYVPSPALVKALLINGAKPIDGYTYPGNRQGWGKIDLANSLLEKSTKRFYIVNQNISLTTNDDQLYFFNTYTDNVPLRITLTWTDVPGSSGSSKNLVNDLDLILESPDGKMYYGNYFQNGKSADGGEADEINNIEGIFVPEAPKGSWMLTILGSNVPEGPQDFALVIAGDISTIIKGIRDIEVLPSLDIPTKTYLEGDTIVLTSSFKNSGTVPTINVRYRLVMVTPDLVEVTLVEKTVPLLQIQEVYEFEYNWSAVRGYYTFRIITDPFNAIREENELNNHAEKSVLINHFGIEAIILEDIKTIRPEKEAKFTLQILNTGSLSDTYTITHTEPPADWKAESSFDDLAIGSNDTEAFSFYVTPPAYALANETLKLDVKMVSQGNSTYQSTIQTTTIVEQYYEFHLEHDALEKPTKPGELGRYNITINNTGNGKDTFLIGYTGGKHGWEWSLSDEQITLPARFAYNITVFVIPPEDGLAGEESDIKIYIVNDVKETEERIIKSSVDKVYQSKLDIVIPKDTANTNAKIRYPLTVYNQGNVEDTYLMRYTIPLNWTANFTKPELKISPREFERFYLNMQVPLREFPDQYFINISLESKGTGIIKDYSVKLEVNQYHEIHAEIIPLKDRVYQGQSAEYTLKVTNYGTGPDSVALSIVTSPANWRATFGNTALGLNYEGSNTTVISIKTDVLDEDGQYLTVIKITSAGDQSIFVQKDILTELDHTLEYPEEEDDGVNKTEVTNDILGMGPTMDIIIILLIVIIIFIITVGIITRQKKKRKEQEQKDEERQKEEDKRIVMESAYKSLYQEDIKSPVGKPRTYELKGDPFAPKPDEARLKQIRTDYLGPLEVGGRQSGFSRDTALPLGPLPLVTGGTEEGISGAVPGPVDGGEVPRLGPGVDVKLPKEYDKGAAVDKRKKDLSKREIFIPEEPTTKDEFKSIKPETSKDFEFEKKGPELIKSTPKEWESYDADEYEKRFEFGSGPTVIDSKKKKR